MKQKSRKAKIPTKSIRNYKEGYFVESNKYADGDFTNWQSDDSNRNDVNSGAQFASSGVNMLQPVNGDTNAGLSAASGALSGAGVGFKYGGIYGAAAGAVIGGVAGLVTGGKKHAAYERQQLQNTQNAFFNQRSNMQTQNIDPYGSQMAYGDFVEDGGGNKPKANLNQYYNFPNNNDPYWKSHPLMTEHSNGDFRAWGEKPNPYQTPLIVKDVLQPNNILPSDKALGQSNSFYPSNSQPTLPTPAAIHSNSGYYANGASIGLTGKATGKFSIPNAGLRRFAPHMQRVGKINPLPSNNINFSTTSQDDSQHMESGDMVNSQQNQINIQKGELLIDPNKGKILQEYNGINPLTGGLFEPHSKDKSKESPNNFTLADPGLFVITKKTAKQYKDAVDNNDKISQKTVLMNIRNAKIQKEGGLQPLGGLQDDSVAQGNYADGDQITGVNPALYNPNSSSQYDGNFQAIDNRVQPYTLPLPSITGTSPVAHQSGFSKLRDSLTNYSPSLLNIGQGLFGNVQHQAYATPVTNPYASQVIANMPKNVNMQATINDIYSNQELANKSIEAQTNSAGVYRSNRQSLAANSDKVLTDARMKASEINNQAAGQRAYMYNALGYQNQQEQQQERQYNLGVDEINAKRQGAKSNLLNAGLGQLQQTAQNDKLNTQKAGMDKLTLEMLSQTFPNTRYYNQFQIDYINKLLGR